MTETIKKYIEEIKHAVSTWPVDFETVDLMIEQYFHVVIYYFTAFAKADHVAEILYIIDGMPVSSVSEDLRGLLERDVFDTEEGSFPDLQDDTWDLLSKEFGCSSEQLKIRRDFESGFFTMPLIIVSGVHRLHFPIHISDESNAVYHIEHLGIKSETVESYEIELSLSWPDLNNITIDSEKGGCVVGGELIQLFDVTSLNS